MVKKTISRIYMALIFLFLYLPIMVLVVLSFNNSKSRVKWGGFTTQWYISMFQNKSIMDAFTMTLQITLTASVLATIIGTLAAIGIRCHKYPSAQCRYCYRYFHDVIICTFYKTWIFNCPDRTSDI